MAHGSRICPQCGGLNAIDAGQCYRCQVKLHAPGMESLLAGARSLLAEGNATAYLALLNLVVYGLMVLGGGIGGGTSLQAIRFGALVGPLGDAPTELYRYVAAGIVHLGFLHLFMNGWALLQLGREVEGRLGSPRTLVIFGLTSVAGFVVSTYWFAWTGSPYVTAGASAGLFGFMGAQAGSYLHGKREVGKQLLVQAVLYAVIAGLMFPANNAAHGGGLVAGVVLGYLFGRERRTWGLERPMVVLALLVAVALPASVFLSTRSPLTAYVLQTVAEGQ